MVWIPTLINTLQQPLRLRGYPSPLTHDQGLEGASRGQRLNLRDSTMDGMTSSEGYSSHICRFRQQSGSSVGQTGRGTRLASGGSKRGASCSPVPVSEVWHASVLVHDRGCGGRLPSTFETSSRRDPSDSSSELRASHQALPSSAHASTWDRPSTSANCSVPSGSPPGGPNLAREVGD